MMFRLTAEWTLWK